MSRKGAAPKREVLADPIYNSKKVTKLINQIMLDGKKGAAERAVYGALLALHFSMLLHILPAHLYQFFQQ